MKYSRRTHSAGEAVAFDGPWFPLMLALLLAIPVGALRAADVPETIAQAMPATQISSTSATVIDGLYEVVAGDNVLYVDASGRYLVVGSIYDLHEDRDLSAERRAEVRSSSETFEVVRTTTQVVKQPPVDAAITTGKGERSLTVITDPNCGWCRRMWVETLSDLEGVEVNHLLLHDTAQARGILCADDPAAELSEAFMISAVTAKTPVPDGKCRREAAQKINSVIRFAESVGTLGTPVLIREDGTIHLGYLGRSELISWLGGNTDDT